MGEEGRKTGGIKWGAVNGLCAVVATSQTDGAALIVWYVHRGGVGRGNIGWGEEWFPGIAQQNKRKKGGRETIGCEA